MTSTQRYFDTHARAFDRLYAGRSVAHAPAARTRARTGARGLGRGAGIRPPHVLDVGCGPGPRRGGGPRRRRGDLRRDRPLAAMLALARERLDAVSSGRAPRRRTSSTLEIARTFDVVLALGLFDYLEEPARAAAWMRARCSSTLVASFTRWDWVKAPLRHLRYELLQRLPDLRLHGKGRGAPPHRRRVLQRRVRPQRTPWFPHLRDAVTAAPPGCRSPRPTAYDRRSAFELKGVPR